MPVLEAPKENRREKEERAKTERLENLGEWKRGLYHFNISFSRTPRAYMYLTIKYLRGHLQKYKEVSAMKVTYNNCLVNIHTKD